MGPSFNLISSQWLPVRRASGRMELIRPDEITSGWTDPIVDVDLPRPDLRVALYEFLIGLFATACPPRDGDEWLDSWNEPLSPDQLSEFLRPMIPAFTLDGAGPRFLQDFEDLTGETLMPEALFLDAPGGNTLKLNKDFFVKRGRTSVLSRDAAALALYALQAFASSGGAGYRTSIRGGGPLTTLVFPGPLSQNGPRTLWHRLWANVPVSERPEPTDFEQIFPWLSPTRVSDKGQTTPPADAHPLQQFWGMPRRIRLAFVANTDGRPCDLTGRVDETIVVGLTTKNYGINYTGWQHQLTPHYRVKPTAVESLPVHAPEGRLGFRHWLGMTYRNSEGTSIPARAISDFLNERAADIEPTARREATIFAAGFAMDNAKAISFAEADMPLHATADPELRQRIASLAERAVGSVRDVEWLVGASVRRALYARDPKAGASTVENAKERLWDMLEGEFHALLDRAVQVLRGPEPEKDITALHERWLQTIRQRAFTIFDDTAPLDAFSIINPERIVEARRSLSLALAGYGPVGKKLFERIGLPPPEQKSKSRKSAAKTKESAQ